MFVLRIKSDISLIHVSFFFSPRPSWQSELFQQILKSPKKSSLFLNGTSQFWPKQPSDSSNVDYADLDEHGWLHYVKQSRVPEVTWSILVYSVPRIPQVFHHQLAGCLCGRLETGVLHAARVWSRPDQVACPSERC